MDRIRKYGWKGVFPRYETQRDIQLLALLTTAVAACVKSRAALPTFLASQVVLNGCCYLPYRSEIENSTSIKNLFNTIDAHHRNPLYWQTRRAFRQRLAQMPVDERNALVKQIAKESTEALIHLGTLFPTEGLINKIIPCTVKPSLPRLSSWQSGWQAFKNRFWFIYNEVGRTASIGMGTPSTSADEALWNVSTYPDLIRFLLTPINLGIEFLTNWGFPLKTACLYIFSACLLPVVAYRYLKPFAPPPAFLRYGINLSQKYRKDPWPDPVGRSGEIRNLADHIDERQLILGSSGVGKTELIKGLAAAIERRNLPTLEGKEVFWISASKLLMGRTWLRDSVQDAFALLEQELQGREDRVILCIDEVHALARPVQGRDNPMIETFITFLDRTKCNVIALTTDEDFKNYIAPIQTWVSRLPQTHLEPLPKCDCEETAKQIASEQPLLKLTNAAIKQLLKQTEKRTTYGAAQLRQLVNLTKTTLNDKTRKLRKKTAFRAMERIQKLTPSPFLKHAYGLLCEEVDTNITADFVLQCDERLKKASVLATFGENLTEKMRAHRPSHLLVGREPEIKELCATLLQVEMNNALLVGPPGVGKTRIVEELALRIARGNVPKRLCNRPVYQISVQGLAARGGQLVDRVRELIDAAHEENAILFIDEMHTIEGLLANMIKPASARGEVTIIGATTTEEYTAHVKPDKALTDRFTQIEVKEPSNQEVEAILKTCKASIEKQHSCTFSDEIIGAVIQEADKKQGHFPRKAITLLDRVGSYCELDSSADGTVKKKHLDEALGSFEEEIL